jgi:hypothetical protein
MTRTALLLMVAIALAACGDGEPNRPDVTGVGQTRLSSPAAASPTAAATAVSTEEPAVHVTGLFEEPRELAVPEKVALRDSPNRHIWDGESTMLYDTLTGVATNLGPGTVGNFSPDGSKMAWVAIRDGTRGEGEAWMIEIASGERRMLGVGRLAQFVDDRHAGITRGNNTEIINVETGEREMVEGIPNRGDPYTEMTPDGYALRQQYASEYPYPASKWSLTDPRSNRLLLKFDAFRAVPAGHGALAVATPLNYIGEPDASGHRSGTTNVFLVDIASGEATFIATAPWARLNWPLAANDSYVAWTGDFCADKQGLTTLYERDSRRLLELEASLWLQGIAEKNVLVAGAFGPKEIIDLEQLTYRFSLAGAGDTTGTADARYVSAGRYGGHGGLCP